MSVWSDMHRRSIGARERKENLVEPEIGFPKIKNVEFTIRTVDKNGLPQGYVPKAGDLVYMNEDCALGKKGTLVLYTGNLWEHINSITQEYNIQDLSAADTGVPTYQDRIYGTINHF